MSKNHARCYLWSSLRCHRHWNHAAYEFPRQEGSNLCSFHRSFRNRIRNRRGPSAMAGMGGGANFWATPKHSRRDNNEGLWPDHWYGNRRGNSYRCDYRTVRALKAGLQRCCSKTTADLVQQLIELFGECKERAVVFFVFQLADESVESFALIARQGLANSACSPVARNIRSSIWFVSCI